MPRRAPIHINGQTATWFNEQLLREYNAVVNVARRAGIGAREWNAVVYMDQWSGVRWKAVRLYSLRRRIMGTGRDYLIDRMPTPSLLEQLPSEWYTNGIPAPRPRAPRTETAQVALESSLPMLDNDLQQFQFGVEIECYLPNGMYRNTMARKLLDAGIPTYVESFNRFTREHWKITTDSSLNDYTRGIEVVSPILQGLSGIAQMRQVLKLLEDNGCTVRRRAGFHVHVGTANQPVTFFRNLIKLYGYFEGSIDSITAQSRRGDTNTYCRSTKTRLASPERLIEIDSAIRINELAIAYASSSYRNRLRLIIDPDNDIVMQDRVNRFLKVNLAAYWRHRTVEFRQHQGTVNADKAEHWVRFCLRMVAAAVANVIPEGEDSLQNLASRISIPSNEVTFWNQRVVTLSRVQTERR